MGAMSSVGEPPSPPTVGLPKLTGEAGVLYSISDGCTRWEHEKRFNDQRLRSSTGRPWRVDEGIGCRSRQPVAGPPGPVNPASHDTTITSPSKFSLGHLPRLFNLCPHPTRSALGDTG